jgi:hypothetical protein
MTTTTKNYIFCNDKYGLYFGEKISYDPTTGVAEVRNCRHISRWYGRWGGITSLASHGLCGENKNKSRIGCAAATSTLTHIVNVHECSPEAAESIIARSGVPADE